MIIASRTPEGEPNRCPLCRATVRIEPSTTSGDAPCPNCGHLLWFLNVSGQQLIFDQESSRALRDRLLPLIEEFRADSLDIVELVMALEEDVDIDWLE